MGRAGAGAPLQVLLAHHSFARQQIRIGPAQPVRLVGAMEIDHQVVRSRGLYNVAIKAHHPLVVAVHKVDLHAGDAPLFKERKGLVHVFVHGTPVRPEPDLDLLFFRVAQQLRHVDLWSNLGNVGQGRVIVWTRAVCLRPARVNEHVLESGCRGKVNIVLHGRRVHAGFEAHAGRGFARPPVPRRFARLDPRRVRNLRWRIQVENHVGLDQLARLVANHHDAPRAVERSRGFHGKARRRSTRLIHVRRQICLYIARPKLVFLAQIHARVVVDVGLGNRNPAQPRLFGKKRQPDQPVGVQSAHLSQLIGIFVGGLVPLKNQRIGCRVFSVGEFGELIGNADLAQRRLLGDKVAKGRAVVEGAHFNGQLAAGGIGKVRTHSVVVVAHGTRLANRDGVGFIDRLRLCACEVHARTQGRLTYQIQAQPGRFHQPLAVELDCVTQVAGGGLAAISFNADRGSGVEQEHRDLAVGRADLQGTRNAGLSG